MRSIYKTTAEDPNVFERHHLVLLFVLGEIAQDFPEVVEEIYYLGHEIASRGHFHVDLSRFN